MPLKCTCHHCGNDFFKPPSAVKKGEGKYCSQACRSAFGTRERSCRHCGKSYRVSASVLNRSPGSGTFCSLECYNASFPKQVERKCMHCGKQFSVSPSTVQRGGGKYCSHTCLNRATAMTGRANPNWQGGKTTLLCPKCGKQFMAYIGGKSQPKFCSPECRIKHTESLTGAARYNFKGPSKWMACEVCGAERLVRYSLQKRFRACSKRCASELARRMWPRRSSLEIAMEEAFTKAGMHPVPQFPIGIYTVDFAFVNEQIIVECDGVYWHGFPAVRRRDRHRDRWLRSQGWEVIRLQEPNIVASPDQCVAHVMSTKSDS